MYDDESEVESSEDPLNWADAVWALLSIPYFTAQGCLVALAYIRGGLTNTSRCIDRRKRFAAEAGTAIESMTRGDM